MKCILLTIALLCIGTFTAFSQPANNETKARPAESKLYLPAASLDDSVALARAIPGLAKAIVAYQKEKDVSYYRQASTSYFFNGDYSKVIETIDSVQKKTEDPMFREDYKVYAAARLKDADGKHFKEIFQKEYSAFFNKLTFMQKVDMGGIDSSAINYLKKVYTDRVAELKKIRSDSITIKEAKELSGAYRDYTFYSEIFPLLPAYINDPKYKQSFPAIKGNSWGGVMPVEHIDEVPDPKMQYKFVMELTSFGLKNDSNASKDINLAIRDIARTINLHVAAGIPKENIDIVLAVHGSALNAFLNNEKYKKKYEIDNPNIPLLKELQDFGVKIILCGQAMQFQQIPKENFIPGVKVALTAQTVISSYQLKNYVFSDLSLRE